MDINFHYFAIKAAACVAGFNDTDAQTLASYSQFVDDYTTYQKMVVNEVPSFARHLANKKGEDWEFHPITTGFGSWTETARLITPENQKNILIPFHFIPPQPLNSKIGDRKELRTYPTPLQNVSQDNISSSDSSTNSLLDKFSSLVKNMAAKMVEELDSHPPLIKSLLIDAKQKYQQNTTFSPNLIRMGILLHIYADTYAHQGFSGFQDWENHTYLTSVHDNRNGDKDITVSYVPGALFVVPSLGHANVGHVPDQAHVTFTMAQKPSKNSLKYSEEKSRNNTSIYLTAAKEIVNYLRECLGLDSLAESEWMALSFKFQQGFLAPEGVDLSTYWKSIFPNVNFSYNKKELFEANDNFFHYNVLAKEIREYVQGGKNLIR